MFHSAAGAFALMALRPAASSSHHPNTKADAPSPTIPATIPPCRAVNRIAAASRSPRQDISLSPRKRAEKGKGVHYKPRTSCPSRGTQEGAEDHFEPGRRRDMNIEPFDHDKALLAGYGLQQFDKARRLKPATHLR